MDFELFLNLGLWLAFPSFWPWLYLSSLAITFGLLAFFWVMKSWKRLTTQSIRQMQVFKWSRVGVLQSSNLPRFASHAPSGQLWWCVGRHVLWHNTQNSSSWFHQCRNWFGVSFIQLLTLFTPEKLHFMLKITLVPSLLFCAGLMNLQHASSLVLAEMSPQSWSYNLYRFA